jgi:GDP-4-dehydro-6-deoxy-D-mannose reductase
MASQKKIIVLGSSGFIGRNLCTYLTRNQFEVIRADRSGAVDVPIDVLDPQDIRKLLERYSPGYIINLVGFADDAQPELLYKLNVFPLINIAEAILALKLPTRVMLISSAAEFGESEDRRPIKDDQSKKPTSHYGNAKLAQSLAARVYHQRYGLDIVIGRPFNIIGDDMSMRLVPACFVEEFVNHWGQHSVLELKTKQLDPVRDFISINDVVSALHIILTAGISGESYNICSGVGVSIRGVIDVIARVTSTATFTVRENSLADTGNAIMYSVGDNSKLRKLGWECMTSVERGVINLVAARKRISGDHNAGSIIHADKI